MFTGLIEAVCRVSSVRRTAGAMQLTIELGNIAGETKIGDSIAINGACLSIAKLAGCLAVFDVSSETLEKSTLGELKPSSNVPYRPPTGLPAISSRAISTARQQ